MAFPRISAGMFKDARISLTLWYTFVIMLVSVSFSAIIYKGIALEIDRRVISLQTRLNTHTPRMADAPLIMELFEEDGIAAKQAVAVRLAYINGALIIFSAIAGYLMAGKTLEPIEEAHEEQKRFVADASHELKTPLTALKTSIEVALRDKKMSAKDARAVLSESLTDINNLETLNTNLLSLARFGQNGTQVPFTNVKIKPILKDVLQKLAPVAKENKITLTSRLTDSTILGNEEQLSKLFMILLDNALKYTPEKGKVTVTAKATRRRLTVVVKDTGIGIAKKDVPKIFDRFYRADQSRSKSKVDGFGLGLCLAQKIVDDHKADITAKSTLGKGTTFTVSFPLV